MSSFTVHAKNVLSTIFVSDVKILERTTGDDFTLKFTSRYNVTKQGLSTQGEIGTIAVGQAVPSGAPSGISYCVKYTFTSSQKGGLVIDFGGLDVSKYASIKINYGTKGNHDIRLNGTYAHWAAGNSDITLDIINGTNMCNTKGITTLNSVTIAQNSSNQLSEVYLYSIEFVLK